MVAERPLKRHESVTSPSRAQETSSSKCAHVLKPPLWHSKPFYCQKERRLVYWRHCYSQEVGEGTVLEVSGSGNTQELKINFPEVGLKKLLASVAPIEKK